MGALHGFLSPKRHLCHRNGLTESSEVYFKWLFFQHQCNQSTEYFKLANPPNRRINLRAIMLYKIINHLIDIPADTLLLHNFSFTCHHHHCYWVPYSRINAHLFSFYHFLFGTTWAPRQPALLFWRLLKTEYPKRTCLWDLHLICK